MELRVSRASAVILQRVPPDLADWFLEWQRGISVAAEGSAGYKGTDVFPPADGQGHEWVIVMHFEDDKALRTWLDSPVRAQWIARLRTQAGTFEVNALPEGFGPWFASLSRRAEAAPPSWKMALTVLLALYPTVMVLTIFPWPYTIHLGYAVAMLVGNILSVSILQWALMPMLVRLLGRWLKANPREQRARSYCGLMLVLAVLAILVMLFQYAKIGEP